MNIKKPLTNSASQINSYRGCPAQYYYDRLNREQNAAAASGQSDHEFLEKVFNGTATPEQAEKAQIILGRLENKLMFMEADIVTEKSIAFDLPMSDNKPEKFLGYIDLFSMSGKRVHIIDWKTGRWEMNQDEAEASAQSQIYTIASLLEYPAVDEVFIQYAYTQSGRVRTVFRTRDDLQSLIQRIQADVTMMRESWETNNFPMKPGAQCSYCRCINHCKHNITFQNPGKVVPIPDDETFVKCAKALTVTRCYLKDLEEQLKIYAKIQGKTAYPDGVSVKLISVDDLYLSKAKKFADQIREIIPAEKFNQATKQSDSELLKLLTIEEKQKLMEIGALTDKGYERVSIEYK